VRIPGQIGKRRKERVRVVCFLLFEGVAVSRYAYFLLLFPPFFFPSLSFLHSFVFSKYDGWMLC
jgi:hypothetical protein